MTRFGVFLPTYAYPDEPPPSAALLQDYARRVQDLGFDSVWVFDHLLEAPPSYKAAFLEPATSLMLAALATERVTVGTGVLVLPLRDPVLTAKMFANIDLLSEGRLIFGVGVGWAQDEFLASQVQLSARGRRMDEMLEIIIGLWTNDSFAFEGRHFAIPEIRLLPRPIQTPHPPIWLAGGTVPAGTSQHITKRPGYSAVPSIARVARSGQGLMTAYRSAPGLDVSCLVETRGLLHEELRNAGRDLSTVTFAHHDHVHIDLDPTSERLAAAMARFTHNRFQDSNAIYLMGHPDDLIAKFQARIDAGVEEVTFNFLTPDMGQLDLFMNRIRPHLRPRIQA
ncbi:MAG: LLM class flavin-dependent oxidoreductase [Hyphomicrobiaceae bacterium]